MRRHLQLSMIVPVDGPELVLAARDLWARMAAEERSVVGRLAAEWVLLAEATSGQRVILAPAEILDSAGLPHAP